MPKRIRKSKTPPPPTTPSSDPVVTCPQCSSTQFSFATFPTIVCLDCAHSFQFPSAPNEAERTSEPGKRHRRDNGPLALNVKPVASPDPQSLGSLHLHTASVISGGADSLFRAQHEAAKLSKKFGEEFEAKWFLKTKFLVELERTHRARARYSLVWRPRFLATVALTRSVTLGCKAAKVHFDTMQLHRDRDPDFAEQINRAEEHAVDLLHDVAFRRALEGDCEPIFWQGIPVGHVKKYDGRLQIEMLRAHRPNRFKTPGQQAIITNNDNRTFVVDSEMADAIFNARQEALDQLRRSLPPPSDGTPIIEVVPLPA